MLAPASRKVAASAPARQPAAVTIRHGELVLHVRCMAHLPQVLESLHSSASGCMLDGIGPEINELAGSVQRRLSNDLCTHCPSLRDALFQWKRKKPVHASLVKRIVQLNAASTLLRHYSSEWRQRLLADLDEALAPLGSCQVPFVDAATKDEETLELACNHSDSAVSVSSSSCCPAPCPKNKNGIC